MFGPESSQEAVFSEISQLVQSALDGYNVCVFAYGQVSHQRLYAHATCTCTYNVLCTCVCLIRCFVTYKCGTLLNALGP